MKRNSSHDLKLSILFSVYAICVVAYFILINTIHFTILHDYYISAVIVLFIYSIGYLSMLRPDWVDSRWVKKKASAKYSKSTLNSRESVQYMAAIDTLIVDQKIYLNCDLKLEHLANELGISQNHASQVINEQKGYSFRDYINAHRIAEVKKKLSHQDNKKYTFLAIALSCGFNNKASFNKYFKKYSGTTPKEYIQTLEVGKPL